MRPAGRACRSRRYSPPPTSCPPPFGFQIHGRSASAHLRCLAHGRERSEPSSSMKLRILIDMNLSPECTEALRRFDWEAVHWREVGDPRAPDSPIMAWAASQGYIVFTYDLDFGSLFAATNAAAPSVIQVRIQDVLPNSLGEAVNAALWQFTDELLQGAIVTVDEQKVRARVLPLRRRKD